MNSNPFDTNFANLIAELDNRLAPSIFAAEVNNLTHCPVELTNCNQSSR